MAADSVLLWAAVLICGSAGAAENEHAEIFGEINGDTYENEFIGYGCRLPGWHFNTEDEIAEI